MIKMNLSQEELQILLQCIFALNFEGKNVIKVGLLADKIQKELVRLEKETK